jgi:hypothetical protein
MEGTCQYVRFQYADFYVFIGVKRRKAITWVMAFAGGKREEINLWFVHG